MAGFIIAFFLGNLLLHQQSVLIGLFWPGVLTVVLVITTLVCKKHLRLFLVIALGFVLGFSYALWHARQIQVWQLPKELEGKDVSIIGTISTIPQYNDRGVSFIVAVSRFQQHGINTRMRLSWYGKHLPGLKVGQQWQLIVRLKRPHGTLNPGGFDFEKYLFQNRLRASGYVRPKRHHKLLKTQFNFHIFIDRLRQTLQTKIALALSGQAQVGMISALTIGLRANMTNSEWQVLRATGTSHLMAISGLHIGLIAGLFFFLGQFFWRRIPKVSLWLPAQHAGAISALVGALIYSAMAGFAIPTLRALIMISVFMLALLLRRNIALWRGLLLALLIILLLFPLAPLSPGFWLSFTAVALILYGVSGRVRPQGLWWKWGRTQWVVTVGLMPLSLLLFQQASWIAFGANIIAIPWVGFIVVPLALLGCVSFLISSHLANGLLWLSVKTLQACWAVLTFLAQLPHVAWHHAIGNHWVLASSLIAVLLLLAPAGIPGRWLGWVWALPLIFTKPITLAPGSVSLTVLDVGQGLASVVRTAHHVLVYDTGLRYGRFQDSGRSILVPFLQYQGISKINLVIISHDHNDHIGGVWSLLKQYPHTKILTSNPKKLKQYKAKFCYRGQHWTWDGVHFHLLYPVKGSRYVQNDSSCVLKITSGNQSILLTGDIEKKGERYLLEAADRSRREVKCRDHHDHIGLHTTVLVAPHHGSKTSSTSAFVKAVHPKIVIFAVGYRNRYKFPNKIVIARYRRQQSKLLLTAHSGAITINLKPNQVLQSPQQYRLSARHYWLK